MKKQLLLMGMMVLMAAGGVYGQKSKGRKATKNTETFTKETTTVAAVLPTGDVALEGTWESKKGVMHPISCHCHNVGYLTVAGGDRVIVCFDRLKGASDLEVDCGKLWVEGVYEEHESGGEATSPCPKDRATILYVKRWKCK